MQRIVLFLCTLWACSTGAHEQLRIVAAGASVTEIVFALDRGDHVVATDSTSYYPHAAAELTKLGYFRQLSTEGVLAQNPTHVLGAAATGPDAVLQQLEAAGVRVIKYNHPRTLDGLLGMIGDIGEDLDATANANTLKLQVKHSIDTVLQSSAAAQVKGKKALYVVANNDRGLTVAGSHTLPDALFSELGMHNIASSLNEYKLMSNESVMQANPDVIFMASHFGSDQAAIEALCAHPAIAMTHAGKQCAVTPLSSATSLGLSPRVADTLAQIVEATVATDTQQRD
ncbi:iron complex transport system substrate-binding protein [Marisediminitalea aggregata]|uniref:Iron complex transport system substrate-binding protein n=1 Tax=Marisediminitalea aggregata TaxID=634436 RepID=A0A1M5HSB3_9ALTE|nr:ABC transporter substrate-binding protein [Marisediminitalea aggregata]SHG18827.1 iron complex transport system substrate-binding protein [Marisediminitalea aggregata]